MSLLIQAHYVGYANKWFLVKIKIPTWFRKQYQSTKIFKHENDMREGVIYKILPWRSWIDVGRKQRDQMKASAITSRQEVKAQTGGEGRNGETA